MKLKKQKTQRLQSTTKWAKDQIKASKDRHPSIQFPDLTSN